MITNGFKKILWDIQQYIWGLNLMEIIIKIFFGGEKVKNVER